ncbi:hypothetical protein A2U01_0118294, partial [Trifolium medium]|nr:hypothetical protein [Trifolium medium]
GFVDWNNAHYEDFDVDQHQSCENCVVLH